MSRLILSIVCVCAVLLASAPGSAEVLTIESGADCKPATADKLVRVTLRPETAIGDVLKWAASMACQSFRIDSEHAARTVTVSTQVSMTFEQAKVLLKATLAAAGLSIRLGKAGPEVAPDGKKPRQKAVVVPGDAPQLKLASKLVATVVGPDVDRTSAAFRDAKGRQHVVGLGEKVDGAVVLAVQKDRVYLRQGKGKAAQLGVIGFGPAGEVAPPVDATVGGVDLRGAIKVLGERRWEITKKAASIALSDYRATLRLVKIAPEWRADKVVGWKLTGFGPDSLPGRIGFRAGDVLVAINGRATGDPDQVLAIYLTLKGASKVVATVEREGKKLDLEYQIR
jgi:type II secretion system protein C